MPLLAASSQVDISVQADSTLTIQNPGGFARVEYPIGTPIRVNGGASWYVDIPSGLCRLVTVTGAAFYEMTPDAKTATNVLVSASGVITGSSNALANRLAAQFALNTLGRVDFVVPGVYEFDCTAGPILIPNGGVVYKGPGVRLRAANGTPSALFANHTARLPPVATIAGANVTYETAPDGFNFCVRVNTMTPAQLARFPVNSYVSAVVLGHGALGVAGTSFNNRGYRGVHRVVGNDGVSVLRYEMLEAVFPGAGPSNPVALYEATISPKIIGPGEIDGNGANCSFTSGNGDPRDIPVWWHHCFNPEMEGGTFKRGRTWTVGFNYVAKARVRNVLARLRDDGVVVASTDFIHLCGQQDDTIIEGSEGDSGDNFVGFTQDCTEGTAFDFPFQWPGDMRRVRIIRTNCNSTGSLGGYGGVAMYGPAAYRYFDIVIEDIGGQGAAVVQLSNYAPTNQNNLTVNNLRVIRANTTSGAQTVAFLAGVYTMGTVVIEDVYNGRSDVGAFDIATTATGTIRSLTLRRVGSMPYDNLDFSRASSIARFGGINIDALAIDGCEGIALNLNIPAFHSNGAGNIGKVGISNTSATGTGTAAVWSKTGAGTVATPVYFNSRYNGAAL